MFGSDSGSGDSMYGDQDFGCDGAADVRGAECATDPRLFRPDVSTMSTDLLGDYSFIQTWLLYLYVMRNSGGRMA